MNREDERIHYEEKNLFDIGKSEQSLINEYEQNNLAQESFFFTTDPITFTTIPIFLPKNVSQHYTHAIYLDNFSFYQMLTFALFQYIFRNKTEQKQRLIIKLKSLICSQPFFSQVRYLKGVLLKAINQMIELSKNERYEHPLAEILMGSEKMLACCQCWKAIISYFKKDKDNGMNQSNSSIIQIFANFFCIQFQFYTKKGSQIILQIIRAKNSQQLVFILPIVLIYNSSQELQDLSKKQHSFSEISSIYGTWSFYILVNYPNQKLQHEEQEVSIPISKRNSLKLRIGKTNTLILEYPELFEINQETSRMSNLYEERENDEIISKARKVIGKGKILLKEMKNFCKDEEFWNYHL